MSASVSLKPLKVSEPHPQLIGEGDSIFCLICGIQWRPDTTNSVIKWELVEAEDNEGGGGVGIINQDKEGYREDRADSKIQKWSEEEHLIFQWFSKWLNLKLTGIAWNSDTESFPICTECKDQLRFLLDVRRRIEELEGILRNGVEELKNRATACEGEVELRGVYDRDKRYFQVRRQLAQVGRKPYAEVSNSMSIPVVLLSAEHKTNAEEEYVGGEVDESEEANGRHHRKTTRAKSKGRGRPKGGKQIQSTEANYDDIPKGPLETSSKQKRGRSKKEVVADIDFELEGGDGAIDNFDYNKRVTSWKSKRQNKNKEHDADFVPPTDHLDELDSSDTNDNAEVHDEDFNIHISSRNTGKGTKKMRVDSATGIITTHGVHFEPLEGDLYTCTLCLQTIKRSPKYKGNLLRMHVLRFHSDRFACQECGVKTTGTNELRRHVKTIHEGFRDAQQRYICDICGKNAHNNQRLRAHRWSHYNEEEKLEAVSRGEKMPNLKTIYPPDIKIQCEDCGMLCKQSHIRNHKLKKHGSEEGKAKAKILCSICGQSIFSFELTKHNRQYHPSTLGCPRYSCNQCEKAFKAKHQLNKHKKIHLGLAFKCPICGKGLQNKKSFTGHMNLHNNVRPFECEECAVAFASKKTLHKHNSVYHREGIVPKRKAFLRGLEKRNRKETHNQD